MAAKGYCTAADVAAFLGITFTAAQQTQAEVLIEAVERFIDHETQRGWLVGAQTNEAHYAPILHELYVRYAPVDTITEVKGRRGFATDEETLTAGVDYEVRSLETGLIWLECPWSFDRIRVTYTPVNAVPADIRQATVEIVAARLQPTLTPGTFGVESFQLPDLSVRFARPLTMESIPPSARTLIENWRVLTVA